ncbi:MAG: hypothetical protein MSA09_06995 [Lachnospiraceae bacterium]|nr:hypothetical protein [Lachnospiraceae bacterium]MDD7177930.1 hypothetical protein [bacterium]MDY5517264.1 hypothetical protein [Lachnospiraceae bacterium]
MATGVYEATKKDGTHYYRANIHYRSKHISLGSYPTFDDANAVYMQARELLNDTGATLPEAFSLYDKVPFEKAVILLNYRDNGMYLGTPIYLQSGRYFIYYLSPEVELKFDNDDLFYYSSHKILQRGGHLYTNDYGMQVSLLSRYGIKNYAVAGTDYEFVNGDCHDFRYENIRNINPYYGVSRLNENGRVSYLARIHINGNYQIGIYASETDAAIAYNKAVDLAKRAGIDRNYPTNYIAGLSASDYADIYTRVKVSKSYREYLISR